jgi:hypothetical protein
MVLTRYDGSFPMTVHGLDVTIRFTVFEPDETDGPGVRTTFEDWDAINRSSGEAFGYWFYADLEESGEAQEIENAIQAYIDKHAK